MYVLLRKKFARQVLSRYAEKRQDLELDLDL
jgi:hypothetical protein